MTTYWQTLVISGVIVIPFALLGRYLYIHFYLSRRLFFEPWTNLSRNQELELGAGLADLLYFELESIRKLLEQAKTDSGLWNEKSALPSLERSFDGYPEFVRSIELLGLSGRLTKLLRLVLLTKPQAIRGTIHEYGTAVRFQVMIENARRDPERAQVRSWSIGLQSGKPESIPDAVAELAHNLVLDCGGVQGFRSSQTFRYFTSGLRNHLDYNGLKRPSSLSEAERFYELAIEHEGGNAEASCNLADLLYSQFTYATNEKAIEKYLGALRTDKPAVRARAFRGLANSHCQRRQRHRRGGEAALEAALRWARFASDLSRESSKLPPEEKASIKKAEAYAQQVWAELGGLTRQESDFAFQKAVDLYKEAIDLNEKFTVAYNNLSYLYLKKAEHLLAENRILGSPTDNILTQAERLLEEADKWCKDAINSERSFHLAYDNKGNIAITKAAIEIQNPDPYLGQAIECYHQALSYQPAYKEAYSDLAKAHSSLFLACEFISTASEPEIRRCAEGIGLSHKQKHHAGLAWQHHWDVLAHTKELDSKVLICDDFLGVRSKYGVPGCDIIVDGDDRTRARDVHCACLPQEVTA